MQLFELLSAKPQSKDIEPAKQHPLNKFVVSKNCTGTKVVMLRPPPGWMTQADALLLAAWLVQAADPSPGMDAFKSMLLNVSTSAA